MSLLPDPHELRAVADRVAQHADAIRQIHDALAARVRRLNWHGAAASAFVQQACFVLTSLAAATGRLDDAADALRRLADRAEALLADLSRLADAGAQLVHEAGAALRDLVDTGLDVVGL